MLRYMFQYKFSILLALVIALLSLAPSSRLPDSVLYSIPYIDKIAHCAMYGSLCFVALMESRCSRQCTVYYIIIILGILVASALIEILQATVVQSRAAEWTDLLANSLGLLAGYLAFRLIGGFRIFHFLKS